ncbi:MAG: amidohydrolase family protein [Sphingobium sp.]|nr:amidohydrolase family protein [Sphingobium sp.]
MNDVPRRGVHNPPPDPNPRRPAHAVPPGSWDCHIHLFGPQRLFAFAPESPYVSDDALPDDYLALQDVLGLERAVVVSGGGYGTDYSHLKWVLEKHGDRLRGVMLPRPDFSTAEMEELNRLGVRGVRMFGAPPGNEWDHLPRIDKRIAGMIQEMGWHVQYHSITRDDIEGAADPLLTLPGTIVIDHLGMFDPRLGLDQPGFKAILRLLDSGRVWMKLSGPMRAAREEDYPYPSITPYAQALAKHAPERMLWGSDWPHVQMNGRIMPNDGDLLDLLALWVPDETTRFRILADNPLEIYG